MKKVRNFSIVTYTESDTISTDYLRQWVEHKYDIGQVQGYSYITHDKDTNEDGTPKKAHSHWVIVFANPRSWDSVLYDLGYTNDGKLRFSKAFCEPCGYSQRDANDNFDNAKDACIRYMTHENYTGKAQYARTDIVSKGIDITKCFAQRKGKGSEASQEEQLAFVYQFIKETPRLDILELMDFAEQNGLLTLVSSRFYMFDKLLKANRMRYRGWSKEVNEDDTPFNEVESHD